MAVAFIMDFRGGFASAHYDWILDQMQLGGRLPEGALYHAAGDTGHGWRVCDVWETAEAFAHFSETQIAPLVAARGMTEPRVESIELREVRRSASHSRPAGFAQVVRMPGMDAAGFATLDTAVLGPRRIVPPDCILQVDGPHDDGWCLIDFWTTREAHDAFIEQRVRPAMEIATLTGPPAFEPMEVHNALYTVATEQHAHA